MTAQRRDGDEGDGAASRAGAPARAGRASRSRSPAPARRSSACSRAASAAPTCTWSTASSRARSCRSCSGTRSSARSSRARGGFAPGTASASRGSAGRAASVRTASPGRENLCDRARFTGYDLDGGYAELCVADERFCFTVPDGFPDLQAAPLLCAGLIGYRSLRLAGDGARSGSTGSAPPRTSSARSRVAPGARGVRAHPPG